VTLSVGSVARDGTAVYVTGWTYPDDRAVTFAYDASTGATLWERSVADAEGASVATAAEGSPVLMSGTSFGASNDFLIVAYEA